jgi:uncharacterized protein YcbK (DUF882 family)
MGDLTQHFSRQEFDSRDGAAANPTPRLLAMLERLRLLCGDRPLPIVSGYRSPSHNKAVGGARDSRHLHNDAADIPAGYATFDHAHKAGATGVGMKGPWAVHVDVRPGPEKRWAY